MELTTKQTFLEFMEKYKDSDGYFAVLVKLPNQEKPELIVNFAESIPTKIEYYRYNYNEDNTLKANPNVRILKYAWAANLIYLNRLLTEEDF